MIPVSLAAPLLLALTTAMSSAPPTLPPCPKTPNCVSTQAAEPDQQMAPIPFHEDLDTSRTRLLAILAQEARVEVVETRERYVHAVFTTALLRFKDDVEFVFDTEGGVIHFRSASRVGRSDLGTNRRRMERVTRLFVELDAP